MDGIERAVIVLIVAVAFIASLATWKVWETDQYGLELGYIQVQNIGSYGYHWEKPNK